MRKALIFAILALCAIAFTTTADAGTWKQLTWRKATDAGVATTDSLAVFIDHNTVDTTETFRLDSAADGGAGGGLFQDNDDVTTERNGRQLVIYWEATATVDSLTWAVDYYFLDASGTMLTGDIGTLAGTAQTTDEAVVIDLSTTTDWTHARLRVKEGDLSHTTSIENVRTFLVSPTWRAN